MNGWTVTSIILFGSFVDILLWRKRRLFKYASKDEDSILVDRYTAWAFTSFLVLGLFVEWEMMPVLFFWVFIKNLIFRDKTIVISFEEMFDTPDGISREPIARNIRKARLLLSYGYALKIVVRKCCLFQKHEIWEEAARRAIDIEFPMEDRITVVYQ